MTAVVSVLAVLPSSRAGVVIPDDLQPGDTYHLAFVTVGIRDALSSDIADYNQFVNDQAALSCLTGADMGVAWFAIASTATVNARDNAVVGFTSPVYLLDGTTRIADGQSDIWNGSIANPLSLDQFLETSVFLPWTGSESNGTAAGTPLGSGGNVRNGRTTHTNSNWISSNSANGSTPS
ncbi:MAG: hypothetical protein ACE5E6_08305, partial [Phycisphaerae bacterium]